MYEIDVTKYAKPERLSDPYQRYSEVEKNAILSKRGGDLTARELTILFGGSMPAGTYDESAYYLPDVTHYLFERYWESVLAGDEEFEELFRKFLMWTVFFYDELAKDGVWDDLNLFLSGLFALATSRFEVRGGIAAGLDHVGYFFEYFGSRSFLRTDDPNDACRNFPFGITDEYMARRFEKPETYEDHAWLVLLVNGCGSFTGFYGVNHIKDSAFLLRMKRDAAWRSAAVTRIIAETEARPELADYWSAVLDDAML